MQDDAAIRAVLTGVVFSFEFALLMICLGLMVICIVAMKRGGVRVFRVKEMPPTIFREEPKE